MKAPSPPTAPAVVQAIAPAFALRLVAIFVALQAVVARAFLHHPTRPASVIRPLWSRLAIAMQRIQRLTRRLAAGKLPWTRRPASAPRAAPAPRPPSTDPMTFPPLPRTPGWVLDDLKHEAAVYRGQLETLLAEPGMPELLAAAPAAARILRPICRMLGLPAAVLPPSPRRPRAPRPPRPPRAPRPRATALPPPRPDVFAGTALARPPQRSYPSLVDRSGLPRTFRFLKKPA